MALLEKDKVIGAGIGIGALIALPYVQPVLIALAKPLVKATIRQALLAYERGREQLVRMAEALEDVLAEVRAEEGEARSGQEKT